MGAGQGLWWVLPWQHQEGSRSGSWVSAEIIVCTGLMSGDGFAERDSSRLKVEGRQFFAPEQRLCSL